jgi:hypothetical protein
VVDQCIVHRSLEHPTIALPFLFSPTSIIAHGFLHVDCTTLSLPRPIDLLSGTHPQSLHPGSHSLPEALRQSSRLSPRPRVRRAAFHSQVHVIRLLVQCRPLPFSLPRHSKHPRPPYEPSTSTITTGVKKSHQVRRETRELWITLARGPRRAH